MIVGMATLPHYRAHLAATFPDVPIGIPAPGDIAIVTSYQDQRRARAARAGAIVRMHHGIGQSYGGDRHTATQPGYPGGDDADDVDLFLCPNEHSADRWAARYPRADVVVTGSAMPSMLSQRSSQRSSQQPEAVAVTFHWASPLCPEVGSAWSSFRAALPGLARRFHVIGTAHPRLLPTIAPFYEEAGIEVVDDFAEVCRRAGVLVADNSSSMYEFAAAGGRVVVLDDPSYRREVHHGLRFWDAADLGVRCSDPWMLGTAVEMALEDAQGVREARTAALGLVYPVPSTEASQRACAAVRERFGSDLLTA